MKFSFPGYRRTAWMLMLSAVSVFSNAQPAAVPSGPSCPIGQFRVINFYRGWFDNVIDTDGNLLFDEDWNRIWPLGDCGKFLAVKMLHDTSSGQLSYYDGIPAEFALLSTDGSKMVLPYREIAYVHNGAMSVRTGEGWGVAYCNLDWLQEPVFKDPPVLYDGYMLILDRSAVDSGGIYSYAWGGTLGLADYSGHILAPPEYSEIHALDWWKEPHFILMKGNRSSLVDNTGREIIPQGDYLIYPSLSDESVWVISGREQKVYYPASDRWVTDDPAHLTAGLYGIAGGLKIETSPEGYRYAEWVSPDGSLRLNASPEDVGNSFRHPFLRVSRDGKYGVESKSGKTILPCIYDNIYEKQTDYSTGNSYPQCVFEGTLSVELGGSWGLADTSGNYLTHLVYDGLREVSEGIAAAEVDGKTGFIDIHGNKVIPFVFDWTDQAWEKGIGAAYLGESMVLFNRQGRIISSEIASGGPASTDDLKNRETLTYPEKYLVGMQEQYGGEAIGEPWVNLSGAGFTSVPDMIYQFPKAVFLDLASNYIIHADIDPSGFPELEELNLSGNQISTVPPSIERLRGLETLNLSGNRITSLPSALGRLKNLETLSLGGNMLETLPDELRGLKSLQQLDLSNNKLAGIPECLLKLKNLRLLNLRGNPIPGEEIQRVMELHPDLEIEHD